MCTQPPLSWGQVDVDTATTDSGGQVDVDTVITDTNWLPGNPSFLFLKSFFLEMKKEGTILL